MNKEPEGMLSNKIHRKRCRRKKAISTLKSTDKLLKMIRKENSKQMKKSEDTRKSPRMGIKNRIL
eukprot:3852208-Heterocapsa_arctica.AAC.1